MSTHVIKLASQFSPFPGGRYKTDGPFNGEAFRDDLLIPALRANDVVIVDLDGVAGLPVSFSEEVFGGLVRHGFTEAELNLKLRIRASSPRLERYPAQIRRYIKEAAPQFARAV